MDVPVDVPADVTTDLPTLDAELDAPAEAPTADFGPPPGALGGPCTRDEDCADGVCLGKPGTIHFGSYPGGICARACTRLDTDAGHPPECPAGFNCSLTQVFGSMPPYCLPYCFPGIPACPRQGYGCGSRLRHCVAGCDDAADCRAGRSCDPSFGEAGACFLPTAQVGDPCVEQDDCPMNGYCHDEKYGGWPGGACSQRCGPAAVADGRSLGVCPGGQHCLYLDQFGERCYPGCQTDADCRPGYRCQDPGGSDAGRLYCAPFCTSDAHCTGGRRCDTTSGKCR